MVPAHIAFMPEQERSRYLSSLGQPPAAAVPMAPRGTHPMIRHAALVPAVGTAPPPNPQSGATPAIPHGVVPRPRVPAVGIVPPSKPPYGAATPAMPHRAVPVPRLPVGGTMLPPNSGSSVTSLCTPHMLRASSSVSSLPPNASPAATHAAVSSVPTRLPLSLVAAPVTGVRASRSPIPKNDRSVATTDHQPLIQHPPHCQYMAAAQRLSFDYVGSRAAAAASLSEHNAERLGSQDSDVDLSALRALHNPAAEYSSSPRTSARSHSNDRRPPLSLDVSQAQPLVPTPITGLSHGSPLLTLHERSHVQHSSMAVSTARTLVECANDRLPPKSAHQARLSLTLDTPLGADVVSPDVVSRRHQSKPPGDHSLTHVRNFDSRESSFVMPQNPAVTPASAQFSLARPLVGNIAAQTHNVAHDMLPRETENSSRSRERVLTLDCPRSRESRKSMSPDQRSRSHELALSISPGSQAYPQSAQSQGPHLRTSIHSHSQIPIDSERRTTSYQHISVSSQHHQKLPARQPDPAFSLYSISEQPFAVSGEALRPEVTEDPTSSLALTMEQQAPQRDLSLGHESGDLVLDAAAPVAPGRLQELNRVEVNQHQLGVSAPSSIKDKPDTQRDHGEYTQAFHREAEHLLSLFSSKSSPRRPSRGQTAGKTARFGRTGRKSVNRKRFGGKGLKSVRRPSVGQKSLVGRKSLSGAGLCRSSVGQKSLSVGRKSLPSSSLYPPLRSPGRISRSKDSPRHSQKSLTPLTKPPSSQNRPLDALSRVALVSPGANPPIKPPFRRASTSAVPGHQSAFSSEEERSARPPMHRVHSALVQLSTSDSTRRALDLGDQLSGALGLRDVDPLQLRDQQTRVADGSHAELTLDDEHQIPSTLQRSGDVLSETETLSNSVQSGPQVPHFLRFIPEMETVHESMRSDSPPLSVSQRGRVSTVARDLRTAEASRSPTDASSQESSPITVRGFGLSRTQQHSSMGGADSDTNAAEPDASPGRDQRLPEDPRSLTTTLSRTESGENRWDSEKHKKIGNIRRGDDFAETIDLDTVHPPAEPHDADTGRLPDHPAISMQSPSMHPQNSEDTPTSPSALGPLQLPDVTLPMIPTLEASQSISSGPANPSLGGTPEHGVPRPQFRTSFSVHSNISPSNISPGAVTVVVVSMHFLLWQELVSCLQSRAFNLTVCCQPFIVFFFSS